MGHAKQLLKALHRLLPLIALNAILAARAAGVQVATSKLDALTQCLPDSCNGKLTNWSHLLDDLPTCLATKKIWWSKQPARLNVTLVTQLSVDRLGALRAQCMTWSGPLAAAVYLPLMAEADQSLGAENVQQLQAAISGIEELVQEMEVAAAAASARTLTSSMSGLTGTGKAHRKLQSSMGLLQDGASRSSGTQTVNSSVQDMPTNASQPGPGHESRILQGVQSSSSNQRLGGCQLRIILMYEVFSEARAMSLYPVNALRNYARLLADTPLIANIDVDMLPSASLSATLMGRPYGGDRSQSASASSATAATAPNTGSSASGQGSIPGSQAALLQHMQQQRTAYVIPAFETSCGGPAFADAVSSYEKPALAEAMSQDCVSPFRAKVAPPCHNATDFRRWLTLSKPHTDHPYLIHYQDLFEPWFISSRADTEWYDVRYKGYGKNKIQQVRHMVAQGTQLRVHPAGFLIHRPHPETAARKTFLHVKFKSKKNPKLLDGSLFEHIEQLWEKHQQQMQAGTFQVLVDDALRGCLRSLPWWKELH